MKYGFHLVLLCFGLFYSQFIQAELQDPTRPAGYSGENSPQETGEQKLNAIIISKDRKIAEINGQFVKINDSVLGMTVVAIEPNTVQLEGPQGKITLFLLDGSIKSINKYKYINKKDRQ